MTLPVDGIKLHRGNFAAIGQQIQPLLDAGQCLRLQVKPWREKRSLSQNALSHMWYTEISEYLIARGKTFATPEWVKDAMKHTYLGYESKDRVDVVSGRGHHRPIPPPYVRAGNRRDVHFPVQSRSLGNEYRLSPDHPAKL